MAPDFASCNLDAIERIVVGVGVLVLDGEAAVMAHGQETWVLSLLITKREATDIG